MSVYQKPGSRLWLYDFQIKGRRFHGPTGQTSRRAAEQVERQRRLEAATGQLGAVAAMTLDEAAGRYWAEAGIGRGDARSVEYRIEQLLTLIGPKTTLGDISQKTIARAIEKRRGIARKRGRAEDATAYFPKDSTVNRDVIETLRPILRRARSHWTAHADRHGLPEIDWRALRLREPRGLSRLYSATERAAWREACPAEVRSALDLLLTYGLRLGELLFHPDALNLDPVEPTLTLQKGRKKDVILYVPLRLDHARDLAALAGRALAADPPLKSLWFEQHGKKLVALTYHQIEGRLSKAADAAGIGGERRIHGARHHAGSTVLKRTGNLKAVQGLLGHASIASSQRYAHVLAEDLRAALEDPVEAASAPAQGGQDGRRGTGTDD